MNDRLNNEGPESRRAARRAVAMSCDVIASGWDRPIASQCTDVSPFGMWLETSYPVKAGDTVVVFAGDYAGFRVHRSGTANSPIVVSGQPGARITRSEQRSDDGIYLQRVNFVTKRGFEIDASALRSA